MFISEEVVTDRYNIKYIYLFFFSPCNSLPTSFIGIDHAFYLNRNFVLPSSDETQFT